MGRGRLLALTALVAGSLAVTGCGRGTAAGPAGDTGAGTPDTVTGRNGQVLQADAARLAPTADAAAAAAGITAFGHDLLAALGTEPANRVVSPLSIALAMSMARVGAAGQTAAEIDQVLRFPASDRDATFNALTRALATQDTAPPKPSGQVTRSPSDPPQPPVLTIANGLFSAADLPIRRAYLQTLASQYGVGVHVVDFARPDAEQVINEWVRAQTADRIQKLFDRLDADTTLVLANAVYLKADWAQPFTDQPTSDAPFTLAGGARVTVPTMHSAGALQYATGTGWQAVELPYAGSTLAMRIIVPTGATAPADLLTPATLAAVAAGLHEEQVVLSLPRWDFHTDVELGAVLQKLGVRAAFNPSAADFSGISSRPLFIDQAVHRANVTVDEFGTEAAAVTGLAFKVTSVLGPPPTELRADHPFAFAIVDTATGTPVFLGTVADPRAGR